MSEMIPAAQLMGAVAEEFVNDIPKKITKDIVKSFLKRARECLESRSTVRIDGLGIFKVKAYAARKGRNPQTGEELDIPATSKVSFKASKALRDTLGGKSAKATKSVKKAPKKAAAKKGK